VTGYIDATGGTSTLLEDENMLYHALIIPLKPMEYKDQQEEAFAVAEMITVKQDFVSICS
jgi:hypothetical protein